MKSYSGILWLALLLLLFGSVAFLLMDTQTPTKPSAGKQAVALPDQEQNFCSLIEDSRSEYRNLLQRWNVARDQKNGIVQEQLAAEMKMLYRKRNDAVFQLVAMNKFVFQDWLVVVTEIGRPDAGKVRIHFRPFCSPSSSIHASTESSPANIQILAQRKQGDRLTVAGTFVERWGG